MNSAVLVVGRTHTTENNASKLVRVYNITALEIPEHLKGPHVYNPRILARFHSTVASMTYICHANILCMRVVFCKVFRLPETRAAN